MSSKKTCIPFRCSQELAQSIANIAKEENRSKSEVLRDLVQRGLVSGGYVSGQQELGKLVQDAVATAVKPQVERLAAISAKAAQISAADFFLLVYTCKLLVSEEQQEDIERIADKARRLGLEYLRLAKGKDADDFLTAANRRMTGGTRPE